MRRCVARLVPLVCLLSFAGCMPCSSQSDVVGPDGGVARCVQTADCPRPSSLLVCTNAEDRLKGCIGCIDGACVRFTPETCQ